jgi:hypothetical protein
MTTSGANIGDRLPRYRARALARKATINLAGPLAPAARLHYALRHRLAYGWKRRGRPQAVLRALITPFEPAPQFLRALAKTYR